MAGTPASSRSGSSPGGAAGGDLAGTYPDPSLAANAVGTADIADLAVTVDKLAADAVGTTKIANAAVTQGKLAAGLGVISVLFDSTLSGDASIIDTGAAGVAQTADHLLIVMLLRTAQAQAIGSVALRCNADTGANYDRSEVHVTNATVTGSNSLTQTRWLMSCAADSIQASSFTAMYVLIPAYRQTTAHKAGTGLSMVSDSAAANNLTEMRSLRWRNTAAITRFSVAGEGGDLRTGSRMTIYGLSV
jgi:hypothetical protein